MRVGALIRYLVRVRNMGLDAGGFPRAFIPYGETVSGLSGNPYLWTSFLVITPTQIFFYYDRLLAFSYYQLYQSIPDVRINRSIFVSIHSKIYPSRARCGYFLCP